MQDFDGHRAIQPSVPSVTDLGHTAETEDGAQFVAASEKFATVHTQHSGGVTRTSSYQTLTKSLGFAN